MLSPVAAFLMSGMRPQFLDAAVTLGGFMPLGWPAVKFSVGSGRL